MPRCPITKGAAFGISAELSNEQHGCQLMNDARALSIAEFCTTYGIGRTTAYKEIKAGRLRPMKVGRRTLIFSEHAEAWVDALRPSLPKGTLTCPSAAGIAEPGSRKP